MNYPNLRNTQESSTATIADIVNSLPNKRHQVYLMLKDLGAANNMILARKLGWPINQVTGRVNELVKFELIEMDSYRSCPITKRTTMFWRVKQ